MTQDAYVQMARELAPYQGRPHGEARPVGDLAAGTGLLPASDPDAGAAREVAEVYRPLGYRAQMARDRISSGAPVVNVPVTSTVAVAAALSEGTPEAGGVLVPPTWRGRRR